MNWKRILLFSCILFLLQTEISAINIHPFYLSVTEIEYFPKDRKMGISIKLFSDDLENAINEKGRSRLDIIKGNKVQINPLLKAYIQEHFSLSVQGIQKNPVYLGYEVERDAIWIYLEINAEQKAPTIIEVSTDLLYDQHEEQINIIHAIVSGKRLSKRLTFPENKCQFKF